MCYAFMQCLISYAFRLGILNYICVNPLIVTQPLVNQSYAPCQSTTFGISYNSVNNSRSINHSFSWSTPIQYHNILHAFSQTNVCSYNKQSQQIVTLSCPRVESRWPLIDFIGLTYLSSSKTTLNRRKKLQNNV